MAEITEYIVQTNSFNYNNQCRYIKNKLLSNGTYDIRHIIFFKMLHVILHKIPKHLSQLENEIGDKDFFLFSFWDELQEKIYFDNIGKDILINYIKLTNNTYQRSTPVKNSLIDVISFINVDILKKCYNP